MKFKTNASVSNEKSIIEQQKPDSSAPNIIEPLTTIPPMKPKKKAVSKSTSKKKKAVKKGESKVALSMSDLYEKENHFAVTKEGTPTQASTKIDDKDFLKTAEDVATPVSENGKPDTTLISDKPTSSRKLGLDDLNEAIESTENMDVDNSSKDTGGDDFVESDPKETDVGPDVGTSLGQNDKLNVEVDVMVDEENFNPEIDPVEDFDSGNSLENAHDEERAGTKDESEKDEEEEDSGGKENEKDVVNVDELELDDVPLAQRLGDSMAKRLRSNKGKVVLSENKTPKKKTTVVTETPKSKTKSVGVGPKKG